MNRQDAPPTTWAPRSIVVGTAGHIDHGKTALVRALTGIDTDRLPEEKRRGITIDLGFAFADIRASSAGAPVRVSFIDVPGHHLFIRNMLAGTGCVDAVMLVVAADEGFKPQTEEHLEICQLLGVSAGITVITKIDAIEASRLTEVIQEVSARLQGSFLARTPVLCVSAKTGEGLPALRSELLRLVSRDYAARLDSPLRMPLDRSFVMKGFGTVVTGTLLSGAIHEGQTITIEPGGRNVRVRGLQTHGQPTASVHPGSRVAANLSGVDVADVHRGQTLVLPDTLISANIIDVEIRLLPGAPELRHRARVHFHAFTSETMATMSMFGYESVRPGSTRIMRIKLEKPIVLLPGDRFVLRQASPAMTIGGGRVLDAHPEIRQRKALTSQWLTELAGASLDKQLLLRVARRGTAGARLSTLMTETGLAQASLRSMLSRAIESRDAVVLSGDLLITKDALRSASEKIATLLGGGSTTGTAKVSELRSQSKLDGAVFDAALEDLAVKNKVRVRDEFVFGDGPGAVATVLGGPDDLLTAVSNLYEAAGLTTPSVLEVAQRLGLPIAEMRRLIALLQRSKTIVRMSDDNLFMHRIVLQALVDKVRTLRGTTMDVSQFKRLTGLPRKYAIPLLEYLDRERVTRKDGDHRIVL
jgi:selenocysteine-specific elongation factor